MARVSDETLVAYLEDALSKRDAAHLERRIGSDESLRRRFEKLRGAKRALEAGFDSPPIEAFADAVVKRIATTRPRRHAL